MEMTKRTGGKINTHYGMSDYYKAYCKREDVDRLSYSKYSSIIADFNTAIIDMVLNDSFEYMLPHLNLELTVRKNLRKPQIKDGKLHNNVPIDFKKTMDLWRSDPDAKERRIKVRHNNKHTMGYVFRFYLKKLRGTVKNKRYYKFKPSRGFSRGLAQRINDDSKERFDCYLLHNKK